MFPAWSHSDRGVPATFELPYVALATTSPKNFPWRARNNSSQRGRSSVFGGMEEGRVNLCLRLASCDAEAGNFYRT